MLLSGLLKDAGLENVTQEDIEMLVKNKGKVTGLTYGLRDLDAITEGMHPSQLIIIAARPAVGKTAFALNIATYAGLKTAGIFGSILATLSEMIPSLLLVIIVSKLLKKFNNNFYVKF